MNRFAVAAMVLFLSLSGLAQTETCRSVQWAFGPEIVGNGEDIRYIEPVDYDEDGKLDLVGVTGINHNSLVWWKGKGDNTFLAPVKIDAQQTSPYWTQFTNLVIADVTGDGLSDVVTVMRGWEGAKLLIFPATGSGRGATLMKSLGQELVMAIAAAQRDTDPAVELLLHGFRIDVYDDIAAGATRVGSVTTGVGVNGMAGTDFDGDGNLDIATTKPPEEAGLNIYFGKADGAFESPSVLSFIRSHFLAVGDLNEDGRPDLVASNWRAFTFPDHGMATVSIYMNQGGRSFRHSTIPLEQPGGSGVPGPIRLADVSGDGHLDLLVEVAKTVTAVGRGDGTFLTPSFPVEDRFGATAPGDFDGDGKLELASKFSSLRVASSTCATQVQLNSAVPMALWGQEAAVSVQISGFGSGLSMPFGTVNLRDGLTLLGSSPVSEDGKALFVVPGLALGEHPLTAEFLGNAAVPSATSGVFTQRITDVPTQTVLRVPATPAVYGEPFPIRIEVTRGGNPLVAGVTLDVDGVISLVSANSPHNLPMEPGNHRLSARFHGWTWDPPSDAEPVTVTVSKGIPFLALNGPLVVRDTAVHAVSITPQVSSGAARPGGMVQLMEGARTLAIATLVNGSAVLEVALSRGIHDLRAVYMGDSRYRPVTGNWQFEVIPNLPFPIEAHAMPGGIRIAYILPATAIASTLQLHRRAAGTTEWAIVPGWNPVTGMDASVPKRGVTYEYRLLATFKNASRSYSSVASATLPHPRRRAVSP